MQGNGNERTNKRMCGNAYEEKACAFLKDNGLKIVERNYRVRQGEIDIIARDGSTLVFIEVKYRKNKKAGLPEEAVTYNKQLQISKTALFYLNQNRLSSETPCRFDVIAISGEEINWIKDAFPFALNDAF